MALTYPGIKSLSPMHGQAEKSSIMGVLEPSNFWSVAVPLASMFVLNAVNLVWAGPVTTRLMKERKHQGEFVLLGPGGVMAGAPFDADVEMRERRKEH